MWPAVNASLNATSALLVLAGYALARRRRLGWHAVCMAVACATSALFLASYLAYHARVGSVTFLGRGWVRPVYFTILISHTVLAVAIVPFVLRTLYLAARKRWAEHTRVARLTIPAWLYVSATGVVVYWMLYQIPGNK